MSELILQTKLTIPQVRPSLIARPHLIKKLNAGLAGKLTRISAPPGFGKTTLVSKWLNQLSTDQNAAWLSLEESDNDATRFFAYLIGAFQIIQRSIGQDLTITQLPPPDSVMSYLINDITAVSQSFILVLDDYHLITAPAIHQAMAYLFEHIPPHMHLVIISRADPPISLSRLRVRGSLIEIRARDLRFTAVEAAEFLHKTMGLDLSADEVALLERRTEGWVAGLQLAAHSLQLEDDKLTFLTAFAGDDRYIADYLLEEVLTNQPEEVQSFLLQTSILDRLNSQLCNALLERQGSQSILEFLEESNLFILPLDNRRQWYRYHRLFADLLRARLESSTEKVALLHRRASQWYAENDSIPQAVEHAIAAADYDRVIYLILSYVTEMFATNRLSTFLQWWQQIPQETAAQNPQLCMAVAWAWLATGHWQESEQCLQAVERALGASMNVLLTDIDALEPGIRSGLIEVSTIRVSFQSVAQVDVHETLAICRRILPFLVEEDPTFLFNPPIALRPVVLFNMGLAYQAIGQLDEAAVAFAEAVELGKALRNDHIVAPAIGHLAEVEIAQGRLHRAAETCRRGIELLQTMAGKISPISGLLHIRLGQLFYEWNQLENSVQHLQEGISLAQPWHHRETLVPGYLGLVRTYRALGQEQEALNAQIAFDELVADESAAVDSMATAQHAWLHAQQGDMEAARRWADNSSLFFNEEPLREGEALILARIRLLQGDLEDASQWLNKLLDGAKAGERWGQIVELLVLQSLTFAAQGDRRPAQRSLSRALELAQAEGYIRTFVDEGRPVAELLRELARGGEMPEQGLKVLTDFLAVETESREPGRAMVPTVASATYSAALIDPLTDRELEILQLIAEGLTNKEIAARLYLSPGTVKVHAHNIYSKLGVNGRTQAVAKARTLNILH